MNKKNRIKINVIFSSIAEKVIPPSQGLQEAYEAGKSEHLGLWPRLYFEHTLDSNIAFFIPQECIKRYCAIFRLLNRVRNCQIKLKNLKYSEARVFQKILFRVGPTNLFSPAVCVFICYRKSWIKMIYRKAYANFFQNFTLKVSKNAKASDPLMHITFSIFKTYWKIIVLAYQHN